MEGSQKALHQQSWSILFGGPDHSTKGANQSRDPFNQLDSFLTPTELFYIAVISRHRR